MEAHEPTRGILKAQATSMDGSSARDLKEMHILVWDLLAELLQVMEDLGRRPSSLTENVSIPGHGVGMVYAGRSGAHSVLSHGVPILCSLRAFCLRRILSCEHQVKWIILL
uniref:Uncharacterized protein n=1 Tax=Eutreptiella gymnastica TaxID=73025 RepID=A0A7S1J3Z3_9EUGL|mmetsp:Transcript_64995/g.115679  ORF Transcript_64995/g.115679 Transcript_64995/m.115679 type:complete len:111 (+) Transcript_64995:1370-1702(+)